MQQYFLVCLPAVHQMVLTLEARGLIARMPGQARSIHLLISRDELACGLPNQQLRDLVFRYFQMQEQYAAKERSHFLV